MDTLPSPDLPAQPQPWTGVFEPEPPRVDFWGLIARRKWLILLGLVIGLGLSYVYFVQAPEWFKSDALIRIRPKNPTQVAFASNDNIDVGMGTPLKRHDKDIASERIVRQCFEQSPDMARMKIFDGLTEDERVGKVLSHLTVRPDKEDGEVFQLTFNSTDAAEAKTLLNGVISTYEKDLEQQFSNESDRVVTTVKGIQNFLDGYINTRKETLKEINEFAKKNHVSDVVVDSNNLTIHNRNVGELGEKISDALKLRAEKQAEILWILQSLRSQRGLNSANTNASQTQPPVTESAVSAPPTTTISDQGGDSGEPTVASQEIVAGDAQQELAQPNDATVQADASPGGANENQSQDPAAVAGSANDPSAAAQADANPEIANPADSDPQKVATSVRENIDLIHRESKEPDPVPGWVKEIFEELQQPKNGSKAIVLTLSVKGVLPSFADLNRISSNPQDQFLIEKNRNEMTLVQELEGLKSTRELKIVELGRKHPDIQKLDANISLLERRIEDLKNTASPSANDELIKPFSDEEFVAAYVSKLAFEHNVLNSQIPEMARDFEYNLHQAELLGEITRKIRDAEEEIKMFRDFSEKTMATLAQINPLYLKSDYVDAEKEGFIFVRLNQPTYGSRFWPNLPLILGLGGLIGSLFGLGLGYFVDLADKTFHNPDEIMKQLSMPLIGHIPVIQQSKRHVIENSFIDPSICTYHRPKSQASEAFRAIRTALFFSTKGKTNSVIQITSPTPGDGKSTIAANVAVSIAQSGKRVLLLDADMRRPTVHHAFGMKTKEGFPQVLNGELTWRNAIQECSEIPGLSLLPCGDKPPNPAELISTPRVGELIEEMRHHYDFIIIDSPPVLAVTDPCPVAARVDGVILTIRIKKNVKISSDRATEILHSVGANLIGVVVNGVGNQSGYGSQYSYGAYRAGYQYNGYGYGYGYSYGYGRHTDDEKPSRPISVRNLQAPPTNEVEVS